MTANALAGDREHCLAMGMDDYLSKPITRQGLWAVLSRWTEKAAPAGSPCVEDHSSAPVPRKTEEPALDERHLDEMKELFETSPGGFYAEMLEPYVSITGGQLRDLERYLETEDIKSIQTIAHTLKGSSRNLGFVGLGDHAESVETEAKKGKVTNPVALTAALHDEFRRVTLFVERFRKEAAKG
jgi:HPt (histidine-containing phosphotransfer) domain-containing protein